MVGNSTLNISIFALFVLVTLAIVLRVSKQNTTAADYYAGGRAFTGRQNGIAITGDYLSAASFLGIAGAIAVNGYDGFLYSICFLVAWLVALLLVAELLRNTGRFTMADVLSFRLRQRPVRTAAAVSTLAVSAFYLLAQMAGAGGLVALLLGITDRTGQSIVIAVVGALMIVYVLIGGMKGTTWVQIIKAALLILGAGIMTLWIGVKYGFNMSSLFDAATAKAGSDNILFGGLQYKNKIDFISLSIAIVLGTAGLPHVLMRFYTVPTAKEARRSVVWAIWLIGIFYLFTLVLGYGAAALVGADVIKKAPGGQNSAAPLLAYHLGGEILLGVISAVAFATILAVVSGLALAGASAISHDIYARVIRKGQATEKEEIRVSRFATIGLGVLAIVLGILFEKMNIAFMVGLAFGVAAAANFPVLILSMYWKGLTTRGALWGGYGGVISAVLFVLFSKSVWVDVLGNKAALFPYTQPALFAMPIAFIFAYIFSKSDTGPRSKLEKEAFEDQYVRAQTGFGASGASH